MLYVKIDHVRPGMRLARPIYNKKGVKLYERDTRLTPQGISGIVKFGLWGLYILEPAEPVPPLSAEDIELERFLTVSTFRLKDDLTLLLNNMKPRDIQPLAQEIVRKFGKSEEKINFTSTLRSSDDYFYKHCLNTAILASMMANRLGYAYPEQFAIVCAALLYDAGRLLVPEEILAKNQDALSPDEHRIIRGYLEKGYQMLHPDYNDYKFPELTLKIAKQMMRLPHSVSAPMPRKIHFKNGTHLLHVAGRFDEMTSMHPEREPVSELAAIRMLRDYPEHYPAPFVTALTQSIHILSEGRCVDFSNGQKGIVIAENRKNYAQPVVVLFSNNQRVDFTEAKYRQAMYISDIMKTMDERVKMDQDTFRQYKSDDRTRETAIRYIAKRRELAAAGRM